MKITRLLSKLYIIAFATFLLAPTVYGGVGSLGDDVFRASRVLGHNSLPEFLEKFGIRGLNRAEMEDLTDLYKTATDDMDQFIGKNIPHSHFETYTRARSLLFFEFFDPANADHVRSFVKHIGQNAILGRSNLERVRPYHIYDEFASFLRSNFQFDHISHHIGVSSLNPQRYMSGPDFMAALRSHGFSQPLTSVRQSVGDVRNVRVVDMNNLDDVALAMLEVPVHYGHQGRLFIDRVQIIASPYFVVGPRNVQFAVDEIIFQAQNQFFAANDSALARVSARFLNKAREAAVLQSRLTKHTNVMERLKEMTGDIWGNIMRNGATEGSEGLRLHDEIMELSDHNPQFLSFMNTVW